ncbi:sigma-70 family RNA polymerase sigma factor [Labrys monachus]|uniref:RNA polymerase sigma factor n=1 Tax=Labrys monachus TaxID=217067 RepID=A0ABU0FNQ7_9HYPH|nr:sigma-70 family RNA polymerase sigma factor [Labrys monachus]MDQ0396249.1 RNA polymerase sigma-70 factor (ECF subfamily) [Labrys monachus]
MAALSHFESLALPHMAAAYNRAFWIVRSREDAEDVVQEAYLRAFKAFDDLRGEDIRPWLLTIVRHVAYASAKGKNRGLSLVPFDEGPDDGADGPAGVRSIAADEPTAEEALMRADDHAMVHQAIAELPDVMREVVTLREIEGLGYQQIADVTGAAIGTVMSRLSRGRKALQARLSQRMERGGVHGR